MRAKRTALSSLFTLLALFLTTSASADANEALEHYEKGIKHYHLGQYQEALEEFEAAYTADPAPNLLFNMAQSHWKLGQYEAAIEDYKQYLDSAPDAKNRPTVEVRIENLKIELASKDGDGERADSVDPVGPAEGTSSEAPPAATAPGSRETVDDVSDSGWSTQRWWAVGLTGAGVAGAVAGGGFLGLSMQHRSEVRELCFGDDYDKCIGDGYHHRGLMNDFQRGAIIGLVGGGVLASVGAVLFLTEGSADEQPGGYGFAPAVGPSTVGWQLTGRF